MTDQILKECLSSCDITYENYEATVYALLRVAFLNRTPQRSEDQEMQERGIVSASMSVTFNGIEILVESRGPAYAVWIIHRDKIGCLDEVLFFAELPWPAPASMTPQCTALN
jgi:hypothetical protein